MTSPRLDVSDTRVFPLSYGQQAIWFIQQLAPESSTYNAHFTARVRSPIDTGTLERAVALLVARHDLLRVNFSSHDGVPIQQLHDAMEGAFEHHELPGASEAELRAEVDASIRRPIDLERGPAFRIMLFSVAPEEHALLILAHHIIIDLVTFTIMVDELCRLYAALRSNTAPTLPPLTRTYREYVSWQQDLLAGPEGEAMRRFWQEELAGKTPVLDLPFDRPRPAVQSYEGASRAFSLPPGTRARVRALATAHGVTPFMVLLAAYEMLLFRYSGQTAFVVGAPAPGRRSDKELETVVGPFMNMLPLRADLSGAPSFVALLARVQQIVSAARSHQEYPFPRIVQEVESARDASCSPVFQTLFSLQRTAMEELSGFVVRIGRPVKLRLGEFVLEPLSIGQQEGLLDIALEIAEVGGEYDAELKYKTSLFDAETVAQMVASFCSLLDAALSAPERLIAELPLLRPEERSLSIQAGVGAAPAYPAGSSFPALFDAQVQRTPEAVAVRCGEASLTYAELKRRADHVAGHLRTQGVGADAVVAIAMERGIPLLVAVLAVLKAGGAYLALDPEHPAARNALILEQAKAAGVLATHDLRSAFDTLCAGIPSQPWTATFEELLARPSEAAVELPSPAPSDLAYVIFTSGSTGVPKGAMVEHRGMVGHLYAKIGDLAIGAGDAVAQTAPQSFVIANWQLLAGLLAGAAIHIIGREAVMDPRELLERVKAGGVTILQIVPSLLRAMLEQLEAAGADKAALPTLRWLVPTGEALPADLCRRWLSIYPSIPLLNAYGCSECSDDIGHHPITAPPPADQVRVPIGRPVAGARLYVLDERREPLPVNVPGDLWAAGAPVGRGYLGDPERTGAVFVSDPFVADPRARMYRTGDRARRRHDGTFEYLGRSDHQVKVRGIRIELEEIDAALRQHPDLSNAAVTADADAPGGTRLTAHVAPRAGANPSPAALRAFLEQRLPAAMIPAAFLAHDALPVNQNGKLDRRALTTLARAAAPAHSVATAARAPESPLEAEVLDLWSELLAAPAAGLDDDFFALGGHSLLALRLILRVRERFGVELPLGAIFEVPTAAKLAQAILAKQGEGAPAAATPALAPLETAPERLLEPFPLTDLQQAYWIGQSALIEHSTPAIGYLANELLDLDVARFEQAFNGVIEHHPMLRAVIRADGRQEVLAQVPSFTLEVIDLRGRSEEEVTESVARVRDELSSTGPEPDRWPMLQLRAHRLDERRYLLHIGFPLILGDLQSFRVLNRDIEQLYNDPAAKLPALELTFRDYVAHSIESRRSPEVQRAERYWRGRFATLPPGPELPLERAAAVKPAFRRWQGTLTTETWQRLKQRAQRAGLTPTSLVAAAYAEAIGAWSRTPHFTLNLLYQNRPPLHPQIQEVIGNFSTTIALEVDGRGSDSFEVRARRLQARLWQDLEHAQISGVQVARELAQARGDGMAAAMPIVLASTLHLPADTFEEAHLLGRPVSDRLRTPHVWIDHQVSETREGLRFHWDVLDALFPPGLVDAMFAAYSDLLGRLADGQGWDAVMAARLPAQELAAREAANATEAPVSTALLHELFAAQARRQPDQIAVIAEGQSLTYGALERRVNALARRLRALGARPGRLVAIVMRKGWEQIVAALSIVTAGAAYLPVDPDLPEERVRYLITYAEAEIILTQSSLESALEWPSGPARISVDDPATEGADDSPLPSVQGPTDLAYVIFTSGSTGVPKGVMIDHRGAVNTILDINRRFNVGPDDRSLAISSLSFDLSVYDIFGLLAAGGAVVLPTPSRSRDPNHWARLLHDHRVSIWNSVPQLMQLLVDHREQTQGQRFRSLRVAMLSGDWIPVSLPARIWDAAKEARVVSLGGATEASIWSIFHVIDAVDPSWQSIPYGRPMDNQRFHVLNDARTPCPAWVAGELYIGGVGLAQGYFRDAEKTEQRFIRHPETGERLYRTGDLGRYLPDGSIEFLGRADFQVKVQGYRIELGEIEAALALHPGVSACVVTAHGPARGDKRLVAYVVAAEGQEAAPEELRAHLARKLPVYMVPAVYVPLPALPLTSSGKVDRKALPSPERTSHEKRDREHGAPRSEIETTLARLWGEVLESKAVSVHDDFFVELGGNSFAAVRLLSRVHAVFGRQLPLASLLAGPTIAAQAAALSAEQSVAPWSPCVTLRSESGRTPLFLVHPIGGNVLCYRGLAERFNQVYGLEARGFLDGQDPFTTVPEMAASYADAILEVQPDGPYLLGGWSMGALVALEVARVLEARRREVGLIVVIDGATPGRTPRQNPLSLLSWFMRDLIGVAGRRVALPMDKVATLDPGERLSALLTWAKGAGVLANDTRLDQLERLQRVFLANHTAMERYVAGATQAPAILLDAADQPNPERARHWAPWVAHLERHEVPGDHYSILAPQNLDHLAGTLHQALAHSAFDWRAA